MITPALIVDIAGWLGAILLLLAYYLVSTKKMNGDALNYQMLNAIGSLFVIVNSIYYGALPSAFINLVWIVIAGAVIFTALYKKKRV